MSFLYDKYPGVIITCPRCLTRYAVRSDKLLKVKQAKCSHCYHLWFHNFTNEMSIHPLPTTNEGEQTELETKSNENWNKSFMGKNYNLEHSYDEHNATDAAIHPEPGYTNNFTEINDIDKNGRATAMGLMIVFALIVSFSGLTFRSMENADIWQISVFRASALIFTVLTFLAVKYGRKTFTRIFSVGFPGFFAGTMLGGAQLTYMEAMDNTTIANATFTLCSIPFITAILARLMLSERVRLSTLLTMFVAAIGISVMVWQGVGDGSLYGNLMALLTAFMFSAFAVTVRKNRGFDMVPALLVSGFVTFVTGFAVTGGELSISSNDIFLSVLWGAVIQSFGFSIFIIASRKLIAAEVTLFSLLEFSLGPIWVWLFINEVPAIATILGGMIVIFSVLLRTFFDVRFTRTFKV